MSGFQGKRRGELGSSRRGLRLTLSGRGSPDVERRRAHPEAGVRRERAGAFKAAAVQERPVSRAEVLDRQPAVSVVRQAGVPSGELGVVTQPSLVG